MTDLALLLNDDFELSKKYIIPTLDRTVDHITVELAENSTLAANINTYTFTLIIKLPSGAKAAYTLTPDTGTKFEKLSIPTAFSNFGKKTKIYISVYNSSTLVDNSTELLYELEKVDAPVPTLQITENGTYNVSSYEKVVVNAGSSFDVESFLERTYTTLTLSVTKIGDYAFYSNTVMQSFSDTSLSELGQYAFYNNTALTSFVASDSLTELKPYTFYGCQSVATFDLSKIEKIDEYALYNCKAIANIGTLKASDIGQYGCYYLASNASARFIYNPSEPAKIGQYGLQYANITEIKGEIKTVGNYGLANLPSTFTKISGKFTGAIGSYGLANNQYVKTVDFSTSVINNLGTYAFYYFGYNRSNYSTDPHMVMDFRNSVFGTVDQYAFSYNRYADIYLPASVSQINNYAFANCQYINLYLQGKAPTLSSTNAFQNTSNYKIYAPWKYLASYTTGTNWTSLSSYIIGYAAANTFTAGETLPEYNAEGYALTWYSDEAKTTEVTTCPENSPALYCAVGESKAKQVITFATSGPISISVTDSSSNPVDISYGYIACDDEDVFNIDASTSETGYTYYIKVGTTKVTTFPYELTMSTSDVAISGTAYDPTAVNPDFDEASWRELKTAVETGVAATLYANDVGKTKEITLKNGQTIHLRLSNNTTNLYDLADGSATTGFAFEFVECLGTKYYMNSTATNTGGWNASYMRTTVMPLVLALLPDEIQEVIATVKRKSCSSGTDGTLVESEDTLFLLADPEVFGNGGYSRTEEKNANTRWQYYANNDNQNARKKNYNGSASNWWLCSPYNGGSNSFCSVHNTGGNAYNNNANNTNGVAPGFCL